MCGEDAGWWGHTPCGYSSHPRSIWLSICDRYSEEVGKRRSPGRTCKAAELTTDCTPVFSDLGDFDRFKSSEIWIHRCTISQIVVYLVCVTGRFPHQLGMGVLLTVDSDHHQDDDEEYCCEVIHVSVPRIRLGEITRMYLGKKS